MYDGAVAEFASLVHRLALMAWFAHGIACGRQPPPAPPPQPEIPEAAPEEVTPPPPPPPTKAPPALAANASYEEALAIPEELNAQDERAHLTDAQLMGPVRNVPGNCRIPRKAKVTAKVAVQEGRAIGVTITVALYKPETKKRPSARAAKEQAKRDAKVIAKVTECFDTAIRAMQWPPNARRDSFTTVY